MLKLAAMLYPIIATVVMGVFFLPTVLVEPLYNGTSMIAAVLIGAGVALPVAWLVARAMTERVRRA
jgi:hypothetical protein